MYGNEWLVWNPKQKSHIQCIKNLDIVSKHPLEKYWWLDPVPFHAVSLFVPVYIKNPLA